MITPLISRTKMTHVIWIRHARKAYSNGKPDSKGKPLYDPELHHLTPGVNVSDDCHRCASGLIKKYGIPRVIICSPYRRTRETAKKLSEVIDIKSRPQIRVDVNIAEYLGFQEGGEPPLVDKTTASFLVPLVGEDRTSLQQRVTKHILSFGGFDFSGTIWVVSHGIVIQEAVSALPRSGISITKAPKISRPSELGGFVLSKRKNGEYLLDVI